MGLFFTAKATLIYTFLVLEITFCKKLSTPNLNELNSKKLSECGRCKVVVDSFNYWLGKTSRGKFEGGDAAWEEAKLKSYSRSEIRLVEIQEGLCSELKKHKDPCYSQAEEAEQALEKWWFHEDPNSIDLYTWLCIENLQHCCPQNHFGSHCEPCPLDKSNTLCGGHGRCDGEGTRKGNGSCICDNGYTGLYCGDCAQNYYKLGSGTCSPCHKACNGCNGDGADACTACTSGWQLQAGVCTDVDECSSPTICKSHQYCVNKEGTYSCKTCEEPCLTCKGAGTSNCTSCKPNSDFWSGMCVDSKLKDELLMDNLQRLALYAVLMAMLLFIATKSIRLAYIFVVFALFLAYYAEKTSRMNIIDIITMIMTNFYF